MSGDFMSDNVRLSDMLWAAADRPRLLDLVRISGRPWRSEASDLGVGRLMALELVLDRLGAAHGPPWRRTWVAAPHQT